MGPNDPFCGHLWLDGVIEPLDGLMVHAPTVWQQDGGLIAFGYCI